MLKNDIDRLTSDYSNFGYFHPFSYEAAHRLTWVFPDITLDGVKSEDVVMYYEYHADDVDIHERVSVSLWLDAKAIQDIHQYMKTLGYTCTQDDDKSCGGVYRGVLVYHKV
jgi:hypothetical protein